VTSDKTIQTHIYDKYKGFGARLGPGEKVDVCKGYWNPQRKMGTAMHFSKIISLELQKNADIGIFLKKKDRICLYRFP